MQQKKSHKKLIYSYPGTAHVTNVHNLDESHQNLSAFLNLYPVIFIVESTGGKKSIDFYAKP